MSLASNDEHANDDGTAVRDVDDIDTGCVSLSVSELSKHSANLSHCLSHASDFFPVLSNVWRIYVLTHC